MTHFFTAGLWQRALAFLILLLLTPRLFAQCNPDVTPPTAICNEFVFLSLPANGLAIVDYLAFDNGSFDECCLGTFDLKRTTDGPCDSDGLPDDYASSLTFCCSDLGNPVVVSMRVNDCAGNSTECLTTVIVEDKIAPILQAPAHVTVSCEAFDPSFLAYGTATTTDNCCLDTVTVTINYSQFDTLCYQGLITRTFRAFDCSGNSSTLGAAFAVQNIQVIYEQNYFIKFPDDTIISSPSNGNYGEPIFFGENCELIGVSYSDEVFPGAPDPEFRIERTWTIINWCTYNPILPVIVVPNPNPNALPNHPDNLPGPTVSAAGSPAPWAPTMVKINPSDPAPTDFSTFWSANANAYQYKQIIYDQYLVAVEGIVFSDTSSNCAYEPGESLLESWTVRATGQVTGESVEVQTDPNGHYYVLLTGADTSIVITLVASSNYGQNCQSEYLVTVPTGNTVSQNVPVHLEERCALLSVGVATPRLRRCFDNRYTVQACNLSSENIQDAYVEVSLDDYFDYNTSSVPGTLLSGNTYNFQIGDLAAGDCVSFTIDFTLNCAAPIGATHCTEARIFPYDDCRDNSNWSGADVEVNAVCDGDSVRFTISNNGNGNMTEVLEFVVVEDVIMRQEDSFQLGIGETMNFSQPANGSTWRLEAQEEPFHPWGGPQAVALEGCGGLNNPGLVNIFPLSDSDPFEALDCRENIGSFDPNDKQGFPIGYGNQHFIKANTELEYLIRFQNTGTDTAFTVVILDTLSALLDPASVRVQVASHPMEFALLEGGILRFSFDHILLPDSNTNLLASNGFVKFRVAQQADLADGALIHNQAAIYFDFNEPVFTNTTLHTIGDQFVSVSINDPIHEELLRVYPNPAADMVVFEFIKQVQGGTFELSNNLGQPVSSVGFDGSQFRLDRKNLPSGMYHFQIFEHNNPIASGKIVLR